MSPRDLDPERLARRIEQSRHNLEEAEKQREREAAGAREWALKHSTHTTLMIRRDGLPGRDRTDSNYRLFEN